MSYKDDVWGVKHSWQKNFWGAPEEPIWSPYYTYPEEQKMIKTYMKQFKK